MLFLDVFYVLIPTITISYHTDTLSLTIGARPSTKSPTDHHLFFPKQVLHIRSYRVCLYNQHYVTNYSTFAKSAAQVADCTVQRLFGEYPSYCTCTWRAACIQLHLGCLCNRTSLTTQPPHPPKPQSSNACVHVASPYIDALAIERHSPPTQPISTRR